MVKVYIIIFLLYGIGYAAARYVAGPELRRDLSWPLLGTVLGLTGLTFFYVDVFAVAALYGLAVAVGVRSRQDALCRFILLSFLTVPFSKPLSGGGVYLLIFSSQMALTIGLLVAVLSNSERRPVEIKPIRVAEFILWVMVLIVTFGFDRNYSATNLLRNVLNSALTLVLPFYLVRACINRWQDIPRAFASFVGAAIVLCMFAIWEAKQGWAPTDVIVSHLGGTAAMAKSAVVRGGATRASATFGVTLAFAIFMALAVFAAGSFRERFRSKQLWRCAMAALLFGLMLTQSRGAWVALAVSILTFYLLRGKVGKLAAVAAGAFAIFTALVAASTVSPRIAAFMGINQSTGVQTGDYRQVLWDRGIQEGRQALILGQSIETVQAKMPDLRQGEGIIDFVNTYLTFFLTAGLVGLVPFVVAEVGLLIRLAVEARRRTTSIDLQRAQYFVGSALGGLMVFLFFCSLAERVPLFFIMLLAMSKATAGANRAVIAPTRGRRPNRQLVSAVKAV